MTDLQPRHTASFWCVAGARGCCGPYPSLWCPLVRAPGLAALYHGDPLSHALDTDFCRSQSSEIELSSSQLFSLARLLEAALQPHTQIHTPYNVTPTTQSSGSGAQPAHYFTASSRSHNVRNTTIPLNSTVNPLPCPIHTPTTNEPHNRRPPPRKRPRCRRPNRIFPRHPLVQCPLVSPTHRHRPVGLPPIEGPDLRAGYAAVEDPEYVEYYPGVRDVLCQAGEGRGSDRGSAFLLGAGE